MSAYSSEWEIGVSLFTAYISADCQDLFVATQIKYA